jgi:hypothetical protein
MANITETIMVSGKSTSEVFEAAKVALPKAGFKVWKLRDIAYMVLAQGPINNVVADSTVMARPGGSVAVSVGGEGLEEADLRAAAQKIIAALKETLA